MGHIRGLPTWQRSHSQCSCKLITVSSSLFGAISPIRVTVMMQQSFLKDIRVSLHVSLQSLGPR